MLSFQDVYSAYDAVQAEKALQSSLESRGSNALERYLQRRGAGARRDGFARMQMCRDALDALDRRGWQRSFHQRMFHENFIRACARVFFKTEPAGAFARAHQTVLDLNGWDNLSQEILISTPRRRVSPGRSRSLACPTRQPGPSQLPCLSHASTPVEGRQRGRSWLPALTCSAPRKSEYLLGSSWP